MLVVIACIYVPWGDKASNGGYKFFGYSFIWQPPLLDKNNKNAGNADTLEFQNVILELIALTALFGGLYALTLKPKKEQTEK